MNNAITAVREREKDNYNNNYNMMCDNHIDDDVMEENNYHCDNSLQMKYRSIDLASAMASHSTFNCSITTTNDCHHKSSTSYNFCFYPTYNEMNKVNDKYRLSHSQSRMMKGLCPIFDETTTIVSKKNIIIISNIIDNYDETDYHVIQLVTNCLKTIDEFDFSCYLTKECMVSKVIIGCISV